MEVLHKPKKHLTNHSSGRLNPLNMETILSLIGLLLSVGLWVSSFFNIHWYDPKGEGVTPSFSIDRSSVTWRKPRLFCGVIGLRRAGLSIEGPRKHKGTYWKPHYETGHYCTVPLWIPTLFFGFLFWSCYLAPLHRRRNRMKLGLCVKCGYDLRGSQERCPECGTGIESHD